MENNNSTRNIENEKLNIIIYDTHIEIKPKQKINKWINKWRDEWRDEEFESEFQKIKSEILKEQKPLYFVEFNFYKDLVLDSSILTNFNFSKCNINSLRLTNHLNATHTFQECNIKKVSAISCYIHNEISFHNSIIEKADFSFAEFDKTADFSKAEFKQNAIFHNTIFNGLTKFSGAKFAEAASFLGAKFENITKFIYVEFNNYAFFQDTKFQTEAYFPCVKFMSNAYFNNTEFLGYADFHEAKFEAVACFYGVTFEKPMNFSSVLFKDFNKINFVNLNIEKIDKESIKDSVEENYKDENYAKEKGYKDDKNEIEKLDLKYKIRWANNFRDSFRAIKNSLIETNNNLEASNLHKLELYAKEIELDYTTELEACKRREKTSTDWNWTALKAFVDSHILAFYRNTSEHHTDFIRILNFTIMVISLFTVFIFLSDKVLVIENHIIIFIGATFISLPFISIVCYKGYKYKDSLYFLFCIVINLPLLICIILILFGKNIMSVLVIFGIIFDGRTIAIVASCLSILYICIYSYKDKKNRTAATTVSYIIFLIAFYTNTSFIIPFTNSYLNSQNQYLESNITQANEDEIIKLALIIDKNLNLNKNLNASELIEYKKFIIENETILKNYIFSKNENNIKSKIKNFIKPSKDDNNKAKSEKIANDDISNTYLKKFEEAIYADSSRDKTIKCISFIYAIILGLCLFSLQKTARRNSVVPS